VPSQTACTAHTPRGLPHHNTCLSIRDISYVGGLSSVSGCVVDDKSYPGQVRFQYAPTSLASPPLIDRQAARPAARRVLLGCPLLTFPGSRQQQALANLAFIPRSSAVCARRRLAVGLARSMVRPTPRVAAPHVNLHAIWLTHTDAHRVNVQPFQPADGASIRPIIESHSCHSPQSPPPAARHPGDSLGIDRDKPGLNSLRSTRQSHRRRIHAPRETFLHTWTAHSSAPPHS
jgi:hypothetical protein